MEYYQKYQQDVEEIKALTAEQEKFRINIQQYEQKKSENDMVLTELGLLGEGETIYKLVGPVLVKEELGESKANVSKRLDFIKNEM